MCSHQGFEAEDKAALLLCAEFYPEKILTPSALLIFDDKTEPKYEGAFLYTYLYLKHPQFKIQTTNRLGSKKNYYVEQLRRGGVSGVYGGTLGWSGP